MKTVTQEFFDMEMDTIHHQYPLSKNGLIALKICESAYPQMLDALATMENFASILNIAQGEAEKSNDLINHMNYALEILLRSHFHLNQLGSQEHLNRSIKHLMCSHDGDQKQIKCVRTVFDSLESLYQKSLEGSKDVYMDSETYKDLRIVNNAARNLFLGERNLNTTVYPLCDYGEKPFQEHKSQYVKMWDALTQKFTSILSVVLQKQKQKQKEIEESEKITFVRNINTAIRIWWYSYHPDYLTLENQQGRFENAIKHLIRFSDVAGEQGKCATKTFNALNFVYAEYEKSLTNSSAHCSGMGDSQGMPHASTSKKVRLFSISQSHASTSAPGSSTKLQLNNSPLYAGDENALRSVLKRFSKTASSEEADEVSGTALRPDAQEAMNLYALDQHIQTVINSYKEKDDWKDMLAAWENIEIFTSSFASILNIEEKIVKKDWVRIAVVAKVWWHSYYCKLSTLVPGETRLDKAIENIVRLSGNSHVQDKHARNTFNALRFAYKLYMDNTGNGNQTT